MLAHLFHKSCGPTIADLSAQSVDVSLRPMSMTLPASFIEHVADRILGANQLSFSPPPLPAGFCFPSALSVCLTVSTIIKSYERIFMKLRE